MNIPTATEFIRSNEGNRCICMEELYDSVAPNVLIKFAQLHVQAALQAAYRNAEINQLDYLGHVVDKDSILEAYPLNLIK